MKKEFKRKPNRKSIIRSDDSRHSNEREELSRERHSTNIKRTIADHSSKATHRGRVVGSAGKTWFVVEESALDNHVGEYLDVARCQIGGLALSSNDDDTLVCVGDWVRYAAESKAKPEHTEDTLLTNSEVGEKAPEPSSSLRAKEEQLTKATIIEIEERKTRLLRQTAGERKHMQSIASNIDQCVIVSAAAEPFYNRRLIDRYLISAEQGKMKPALVINKIELMTEEFVREDLQCYRDLGIEVVLCSCVRGTGQDELRTLFAQKTSMLVGPSGVGKSSIVNAFFGIELQEVREISTKYDKGKHTTTSGKLFGLGNQSFIIDTPGMREFAITDLHIDDLSYYFHDFDAFYQQCKYLPCTHTHEPGCAVKQAVEQGAIDELRYDSYLRIRESMLETN